MKFIIALVPLFTLLSLAFLAGWFLGRRGK